MAIVHFADYKRGTQSRAAMRGVMLYVMQEKKTTWEGAPLVSGINCQVQSVYDDFLNTKLLYHKDGGVMFYHMVQSFPKGAAVDPQQAHEAARRLAEYFDGCEVLVCTHVDREHIHSHCVINSVNFETGKKLHMAKEQLQELLRRNDMICQEMGLPVFDVPTQQARGMSGAEYHTALKGQSWKLRLMSAIDECMKYAADKAAVDAEKAAGRAAADEPGVLDCGKYAGMTTLEARKAILADLKECGFLKESEPLKHEGGTCYRCHSTIEPMISKQWFVKMAPLAKPAIESVEKGEIKFVPERFTKNYMNWMKNTRDWCISRQLWWGHQIPAWYCDDCGETVVAKSAPCTCPKCGGTKLTQDPDTLDTWFSSALRPFSTLGWPNDDSADLKYFYPTNTLVTGYDIIGFWVSRMIFSGLAYTGKSPFDTVCIHGIVRDSQGRKMSKSLGNGIDPLEVIAQYGADALRFMLVDGSTPGNDMRYSEKKVEAARNFANKLWNATRFVLMNLPEDFQPGLPSE